MKYFFTLVSLALGIVSANAGTFVLVDRHSEARYGPFDYTDQSTIRIGSSAFTLNISDKPETKQERLAKEIMIPNVEFYRAHIADIIQFLREASVQFCPGGTNVNIVINVSDPETVGPKATNKATLSLRNVSLYDALRYTSEVLGLRLRFDDTAAVILK